MSKKVYVVDNSDGIIIGVFSSKNSAEYVKKKVGKTSWKEDWTCREVELDTIESWLVSGELQKLGIKVVSNE